MSDRTTAVRLEMELGRWQASGAKAADTVRQIRREFHELDKEHRETMSKMGRNAAIAGAGVAAGLGLSVNASMDFDRAMSNVQAATHETADAMHDLRAAALQAGADTAFTATDAANAIEALAKAGVTAGDILGGGLKGALDLAAAGSIDVGQAAEIAATGMAQFGLAGGDVPHIADLLAAAAGKAQGEVSDMSQALAQAGLVASQMGISIDDTIGTLAAFAHAGLLGSDAGTSFRTMLLHLANPTKEAKDLMASLGIAAYDAGGNFVGLDQLAGQLHQSLGSQTQAARDAALATIFGSDAIRAANVLYTEGKSGIDKWVTSVDDQGYAADTAGIKLDNLAGDLEKLRGSIDTALIEGGSKANGSLRLLAQGATAVVNDFSAMTAPLQTTVVALASVSSATLLVGGGIAYLGPKIATAREELAGLGRAGQLANKGLGFVAKAGAYAAGFAVIADGVGHLADTLFSVHTNAEGVLQDLTDIASGLSGTDALSNYAKNRSDDLQLLANDIKSFSDAGLADKVAHTIEYLIPGKGPDRLHEATTRLNELDDGLMTLATSGSAKAAADTVGFLVDALAAEGVTRDDLIARLPQYAGYLQRAGIAEKFAGDAAGDAGDDIGDLSDSVDELVAKAFGMQGATDQLTSDILDWAAAVRDAKADGNKFATSLGTTSVEGLKNRAWLQGMAEDALAVAQNMADMGQNPVQAMRDVRTQLIDTAGQLGFNRDEAATFLDVLLQVGNLKVNPSITFDTDPARRALQKLLDDAQAIMKTVAEAFGTDTSQWHRWTVPAATPPSLSNIGAGVANVTSGASGGSGGGGVDEARQMREAQDAQKGREYEFGGISADDYKRYLEDRLATTQQYSEEWAAIWREIDRVNADIGAGWRAAQQQIKDNESLWMETLSRQHEVGDLSTADYLAQLQKRLDGLEKYSDEWMATWREINQLKDEINQNELDIIAAVDKQRQRDEAFYATQDQRALSDDRNATPFVVVQGGSTRSLSQTVQLVGSGDVGSDVTTANQRMRDQAFMAGF